MGGFLYRLFVTFYSIFSIFLGLLWFPFPKHSLCEIKYWYSSNGGIQAGDRLLYLIIQI